MPRDHEYPSGHKTPKEKQERVLTALGNVGCLGLTSRELAQVESPGDVSAVNGWGAAFTVLRQDKMIVALTERREDHHVYVMPEHVQGRTTWPGYRHGVGLVIVREKHCKTCTCEKES